MPVILGLFALGVMLVALVVMIGVVGFAAANILAIILAVAAGIGLSALFGGGSTTLTVLVALAVFYIMMRGKQQRLQRQRREYDVDLVAEQPRQKPVAQPLPQAPAAEATPLDLAWAAAAENADWARSRLAVARESCRLFLGVADRLPMDAEAGGLAVRIRRRIPEHVAECLDKCEVSTASERRAILDELVFTLEKVGASADRERARLLGPVTSELSVQRRHLTRDPDHGPITLD